MYVDLNLERLDYLVRVEHVNEDWSTVQKKIFEHSGVSYPTLGKQNSTSPRTIEIDIKTREKIVNKYCIDYQQFHYETRL